MLARWIYVSTSNLSPTDAEKRIGDIINVSIPRNRSLGVTGSLLFTGNCFTQYLEGDAAAIDELRSSIMRDPRHRDIKTIGSGIYPHRRFVTWSLAYAGPSQFVADIVERVVVTALENREEDVEALVELMSEFSIKGRG